MREIPKIVGQRLQTVEKVGDHPDPNLLGAFAERSLVKREQDEVLRHLSQCTSCRDIVSLSAIQPGATNAVLAAPVSPRWLSWPVLRWGTVLACVVVVGAAITLRHKQESRPTAGTIAEGTIAEGMPAEGRPGAELQFSVPNGETKKKGGSSHPSNLEAGNASAAEQTGAKLGPAKPSEGNPVATNSRPVEMAEARAPSPLAEIVPGRAKDALAESQSVQFQRSMGGPAAMKKSMIAAPANDAFISENVIPRWTLSSDGTLQRSFDSGRTWQTIPVSGQSIFRALAANGLDIWVGGTAGALFHSSDAGQSWRQVRPVANGEALADDIIGVEFRDALHGKLTTAAEETWITTDAGQTWQKQ